MIYLSDCKGVILAGFARKTDDIERYDYPYCHMMPIIVSDV